MYRFLRNVKCTLQRLNRITKALIKIRNLAVHEHFGQIVKHWPDIRQVLLLHVVKGVSDGSQCWARYSPIVVVTALVNVSQ